MSNYIVLIRCKPSPETEVGLMRDLADACRGHERSSVFFHGDGVEALSSSAPVWSDPAVDYSVCLTSFERRSLEMRLTPDALPPAFSLDTLVKFYQTVVTAGRVDSLGVGGSLCCRPESDGSGVSGKSLLLEVGFAPANHRQRRETLEMALGAAALELEASVLFHGAGLRHLAGDAARGWAQLTDFDLLGIYAEAPARDFETDLAVQIVDSSAARELRTRVATILIL